jgi:hypothetical protein
MAIFPMMSLPLLMGGITFQHFSQTVLGLLNGILFALASGFLASVVCRRQFTAIAVALGMLIAVTGGSLLAAAAAETYGPTKPLANWLAMFSPLYAVIGADGTRLFGPNWYWRSAATVAGLSLLWLGLTTLLLARTWRDRPKGVRAWRSPALWRFSQRRLSESRVALRRRLLAINPIFWLASRQRVSAPVIMVLAVVITLITVYGTAPFFGRVMRVGTASPVLGHMFAWLWAGMAVHALVLYYGATCSSQRLAEDKHSGALELLLSTPTSERTISRGLWMAYGRRMFFPALLAVLVHVYFLWTCAVMATLDPPGQIPLGTTPGELFWGALLDQPIRGRFLEWQFGFLLRAAVLSLILLMLVWLTLGWVGRWLGLRLKHPGFAPITSLGVICIPPVLLFSLTCYLADEFNVDRLPEHRLLPMMMWVAVAIGVAHCLALSVWAAGRLRHSLRSVAFSRYQPLPRLQWRLPTRQTVWRFVKLATGFAVLVSSLIAGYYGFQNWRGERLWRDFQASLTKRGESLDLSALLPGPVPESENFVQCAFFRELMSSEDPVTKRVMERMKSFELPSATEQPNAVLMEWTRQTAAPLYPFANWTRQKSRGSGTNRLNHAAAFLDAVQSQNELWRGLAAAAARPTTVQISTNRDAGAVFQGAREEVLVLERLHLFFQVRACALLALDRKTEAAEDAVTGLRLVRLARQLPDIRSTFRVQWMLARSLQTLWEGLGQQAWTEPQLAALQRELAGFDLLADHTNAVRRVTLAYIEAWRGIPDGVSPQFSLPALNSSDASDPSTELQPRAWWFENCIQMYHAGGSAIEQVEVATGRIQAIRSWSTMNGLPLHAATSELLRQWHLATPGMVAFAQTTLNQAMIACALERFHLANQRYPEKVDQLVPAFLDRIPHDAVSGRPLLYQPVGEGSFLLRGVGPNGTDDRKMNPSDDWLWSYSAIAPSPKGP